MSRKTLFVKPKLQFKYLLISLFLTIISTGTLYLVLNHILFTSERLSDLSTFEIGSIQKSFHFSFVWVVIILMVVFGLENLFRFHQLVGPIYKIEKMIREIAQGNLTQDLRLRKGDELKDLVHALFFMQGQLKDRIIADRKICKNVEERMIQISKEVHEGSRSETFKKEIESIQKELTTITSQFKV